MRQVERARVSPTRFISVVRTIWIVLSCAVLAVTVFGSGRPGSRDNILVMSVLMFAFSFPASYLVAVISYEGSRMASDSLVQIAGTYGIFLLTWLGFFIAGYVQWFVLLPMLSRGIRRHFRRSRDTPVPPRPS